MTTTENGSYCAQTDSQFVILAFPAVWFVTFIAEVHVYMLYGGGPQSEWFRGSLAVIVLTVLLLEMGPVFLFWRQQILCDETFDMNGSVCERVWLLC